MLAIKLQRIGKKHQAHFRLVVGEKRSKLNGRQVEDLGWYNPSNKEHQISKERVLFWMQKGAQTTDTVHNLLIRAGVLTGAKRPVHKKGKTVEGAASGSAEGVSEAKAEGEKKEEASA